MRIALNFPQRRSCWQIWRLKYVFQGQAMRIVARLRRLCTLLSSIEDTNLKAWGLWRMSLLQPLKLASYVRASHDTRHPTRSPSLPSCLAWEKMLFYKKLEIFSSGCSSFLDPEVVDLFLAGLQRCSLSCFLGRGGKPLTAQFRLIIWSSDRQIKQIINPLLINEWKIITYHSRMN